MTTEPCKHHQEYGEGVEMPLAASLEHFDECFTPERRLEAYRYMRERSEVGTRCLMAGHAEEKALAESAIEIGRRLGKAEGRKQAGDEIAEAIIATGDAEAVAPTGYHDPEYYTGMLAAAKIARSVASQPQEATSEPLIASTGHLGLPEAPEAARKACANCGAYGGNGRIYRQDDTWDPCPRCTPPRIPGGEG